MINLYFQVTQLLKLFFNLTAVAYKAVAFWWICILWDELSDYCLLPLKESLNIHNDSLTSSRISIRHVSNSYAWFLIKAVSQKIARH